ncbi:Adaptor protein-like protein complex AP-2 [Bisporella sp. PMI_857]|nr:Adaptor protein-like protein complex AP-2 [Bisporella sp. PMI_857]
MSSSTSSGFLSRGNSNGNSNMRGLVQFIADLRNARARELEEKRINKELANIRHDTSEYNGNLNGYHKKKYVCKLLYIYILGWNVDFGHLEAVNLISANKYSEKQIGYLAMTLFLHEQHELLHLVVNSIRKDLMDHNELFNCLALHAIANVGGREMGEALSGEVHRLLISPTSKAFVKKKAALTLLRLYRKHPDIVQPQWAERIISLMDDVDMGVALSVTSLVMALAQDNPEQYKGSYVKAASRMKRILVDGEYAQDYLYYKVPCPWIQVKMLRLLQYFPPSEDTHVRELIRESLQKILNLALDMPKNVQQNNAQNAVLFEAINLIIHLDTEQALMKQISTRLGKFIQSRETNVRYLGLEAMTHLAARAETLDPIKQHQSIIIGSLKDRDISVRRKGLDLLYSMCDQSNAQPIVGELLSYLQNADFAIREEMVLKIAILTEKYATDIQWYVDISLRLIAMAGDHVSDEVWHRVIQIVTNNEELQVYAAQNILQYVKADHCHETLVKIGGYILGEFGHLIAEDRGCSPIEQFIALQSKLQGCSSSTRAIILSSFIKFVNLFPEIKPRLLYVFEAYSHTLDSELQQRACEYLALALQPTDDLLRTVCDEMPPFPERQSALLSRLHQKHANTSDKRTWVVGGKDANANEKEFNLAKNPGLKRAFSSANGQNGNGTAASPTTNGTNGQSKGAHDLAGIDMNDAGPSEPKTLKAPNLASAAHLSPDWQIGYNKLLLKAEGILYEDGQVQIGVRSEYRGQMACIILYFSNKAPTTITSFTTTLDLEEAEKENLTWEVKGLPDSAISQGAQSQQMIMFEAKKVFDKSPTIRISYLAGALQALTLKLPITIHKFMDPAELTADDFFKRWKQIGGAPREAQKVFGVKGGREGDREINDSFIRRTVEGFRWGILDGVDPNKKNFVGATVLHTGESGKFGCLLRLEPNYATQMVRLTIRATDESVPAVLLKLMEDRLSVGVSAQPETFEPPTRREISDAFGNIMVT